MFCPTCGRENPRDRKFCSSCGTNLEAVTQALSGNAEGAFSKLDATIDQFLTRYSERYFKDDSSKASEPSAGKSWRILGRGAATAFVDLFLFSVMSNLIPFRFLMLLVISPIRLLSRKTGGRKLTTSELRDKGARGLPETSPQQWLPGAVPSVTEHTTVNLPDAARTRETRAAKTE
ncbi:MAG TPA: zinc ribbon domain-containing protein [Blastocatellia bacterium]|nr:zinc ribbon domain-containing protein [Blastocatellia bacterium]